MVQEITSQSKQSLPDYLKTVSEKCAEAEVYALQINIILWLVSIGGANSDLGQLTVRPLYTYREQNGRIPNTMAKTTTKSFCCFVCKINKSVAMTGYENSLN